METKAKTEAKARSVEIPEGVHVAISEGAKVSVKGPKGELSRAFDLPQVDMKVEGNQFFVSSPSVKRCHKALIGTVQAHVRNMIIGVTEGFEYKLKIVFAHFPLTLKVDGTQGVVDNFLGEKSPRRFVIPPGVAVKVNGTDIVLTGIDKETMGKAAALLEHSTHLTYRDRRIFQDGIYITEKAGVKV